MKKNTKKGFTLVELLVVIAILAILASVAVVGYTAFVDQANNNAALQELTMLRNYMLADDYDNDDFAISSTGLTFVTGASFDGYVEALDSLELDGELTFADGVVTYERTNGGSATWNPATGAVEVAE